MGTYVYSSAQAHINNALYKLEVLDGYEPDVPMEMIDGIDDPLPGRLAVFGSGIRPVNRGTSEGAAPVVAGLVAMRAPKTGRLGLTNPRRFYPKPIYQPEASRIVRANLTIAHMIDMSSTDKYYRILNDIDSLEMLHVVDSYLNEVRQMVNDRNAVVIAYVRLVLNYREKLIKCVKNVFNRHPDWRDAYWSQAGAGTDAMKTIIKFIQLMNPSASDVSFDPAERILRPPYYLNDAGVAVVPGAPPAPAMTQEQLTKEIGPAGISNLTYRRSRLA